VPIWVPLSSPSKLDENDERMLSRIKCDWLKSEKSKHVTMWSILLRIIKPTQGAQVT
jgi:hypothetical protein